jgi:hypothetical protein
MALTTGFAIGVGGMVVAPTSGAVGTDVGDGVIVGAVPGCRVEAAALEVWSDDGPVHATRAVLRVTTVMT